MRPQSHYLPTTRWALSLASPRPILPETEVKKVVLIELGGSNRKEERFRALIDEMSVPKEVCATSFAVNSP